MKNEALQPTPAKRTPCQTAANRRLAIGLALLALGMFASYILRQWWFSTH